MGVALNEPILYDKDMKRLAYLENATRIGYTKRHNGLWTGSFELPADDPKNALLQHMYLVELRDSAEVGLFRISGRERQRRLGGELMIAYSLEHVLATLMDSILYRYHEIGGLGIYTTDVLEYILSHQNVVNWRLGHVAFTRQFQYSWENENLLAAMFSVPNIFNQDYVWRFSTVNWPWTISLRRASNAEGPEIRAGRNLKELQFIEDPQYLCTRLYALGQGEGVNQLGIENVNPTGEAYIDADTIGTYGQVDRVWVDRRYEHEENLYEAARAMLEKLKQPRIEITVNAVDLKNITLVDADRFIIGSPVLVKDIDLGVSYESRVLQLTKNDVNGEPGGIEITVANAPKDIAGTIADLANRSRINEVYSQGATNIDSHQMADNCDTSNPMSIKFHIPVEAVFINKVLLNYGVEAFRAYSTAAAAGGASTQTSSSGGGQTSSSSGSHAHTVSGQTATASGSHRHNIDTWSTTNSARHDIGTTHYHGFASGYARTDYGGSHTHSVSGVTSNTTGSHSHSVSDHTHSVSIGNHSHSVSIGNHSHSVSIGNHSHSVSIPNHTHPITYGIYSGPTPTRITLRVDGVVKSGYNNVAKLNETEVNITQDLAKTPGGMIVRGWHEVTITPNRLGRVNVAVHIQQFLQSKGELRL